MPHATHVLHHPPVCRRTASSGPGRAAVAVHRVFAATATLVVLLDVLWAVLLHAWDAHYTSYSDGVYSYLARTIAERGPGVVWHDVALSQPPTVVLAAGALWRAAPHLEALRVGLLVLAGTTSLLTLRLGSRVGVPGWAAGGAAVAAFVAPVRWQFVGLDGEALLTPLVVLVALALVDRRRARTGVLLGFGCAVKLTWAPVVVAALVATWRRDGGRAAAATAGIAVATAGATWTALLLVVHASPLTAWRWLVTAQSGSGHQFATVPLILVVLGVVWLPLLPPAVAGLRAVPTELRWLLAGTLAVLVATSKAGTVCNVVAPAEPLLALAAAAGAVRWARRPSPAAVAGLVLCGALVAVHLVSIAAPRATAGTLPAALAARAFPPAPAADVQRAADAVAAASAPDQTVLADPLVALVAHRHEPADEADWFILAAAHSACRDPWCDAWPRLESAVRSGQVPVVAVGTPVRAFAPDVLTWLPYAHRDLHVSGGAFDVTVETAGST